jgi:hypothetical protein
MKAIVFNYHAAAKPSMFQDRGFSLGWVKIAGPLTRQRFARQRPAPIIPAVNASAACPNCDTPLQGRFCHACGQKRIEPEERRLSWFFRQLVKALTMADGRLLGSLGRLMFRPGVLERDWLAGRRRRHLAPLSLFLIANLVYFFYPPLTDLNMSLAEQVRLQPWSPLAERMVDARLEARGIGFEEYAAEYRVKATELAKLMVILHVPLLALVLMLLHPRRGLHYVDHLAVSLNFWAFLLFMMMVVPWVLALLLNIAGLGTRGILQITLFGLTCAYAWQQMRLAYDQPGGRALAKLPVFILGFVVTHMIYRAIQFLVAFALS